MTMEELMVQMIKKATLECEEANRQYVASLNGLAGLDIIDQKFSDAAEKYREVLRVVEEHKEKIKTDTLQKLHSVTNLAELLEASHEGIPPTLRDDKLRDEALELKSKYLEKYTTAVKAAKEAVDPVSITKIIFGKKIFFLEFFDIHVCNYFEIFSLIRRHRKWRL